MNNKKQQLLVEYLISSPDTYALCMSIVKPSYFDPELQGAVAYLEQYYNEHHALPAPEIIEAEVGRAFNRREITKDKIEYCANEIEKFCRNKAVEEAFVKSVDLYKAGNLDEIHTLMKEAVMVSLNRDLGIDFFEDIETRLKHMAQTEVYEPTGWKEFDELLHGGLIRRQMLLFSANTGGGKSIVLANLGLNFVEQGMKVLYISLELPQKMVDLRYISMMSGVSTREWREKIDDCVNNIITKKGAGRLYIRRMPQGTTSNKVRSYLKEFEMRHGEVDAIIFDYIDLMAPNEKISMDNMFVRDKLTSEQVREIGEDYNAHIITASQLNRSAVKAAIHDHSHIAGGISKINTTDVYVSITFTDAMKAKGIIALQFEKTRSSDGVGQTIELDFNKSNLRITDPRGINFNKRNGKIESEPVDETNIDTNGSSKLLDLMNI